MWDSLAVLISFILGAVTAYAYISVQNFREYVALAYSYPLHELTNNSRKRSRTSYEKQNKDELEDDEDTEIINLVRKVNDLKESLQDTNLLNSVMQEFASRLSS